MDRFERVSSSDRALGVAALFARMAVGVSFLSAVADRFGLWGPLGTPGVSWGSFGPFVEYAGQVNPFLDGALLTFAAWASTAAELGLGMALVLGAYTRLSALLSGLLLLWFAVALGLFIDPVKPFSFSVFSAAGAAFVLAALPASAYVWSLDRLWAGRTQASGQAVRGSRPLEETS